MQLPHRVRTAGQRVLGGIPVPIASGPNRGRRWSLAALGRGYGSGAFARERLEALAAVTRPGDCFWDVGAHKGFVTLAAARMVGGSGRVVAFEPAAENLSFLQRHLRWNHAGNVDVRPLALGSTPGPAPFGGGSSSVAHRVGAGLETVRVETGKRLVELEGLPAPDVLKIDVEGAEAAVLRGAEGLLRGHEALLISTHSRALYEECAGWLLERSFHVLHSRDAAACLATGSPWTSDHDLLAVGPSRGASVRDLGRLRLVAPRDADA